MVVVVFPNRDGFDASAPAVAGFAPKENDGVEDAPPAAAAPPNGLAAGLDVPLVALPNRPPAAGFDAPPKRLPVVLVVWPKGFGVPELAFAPPPKVKDIVSVVCSVWFLDCAVPFYYRLSSSSMFSLIEN